MNTITSLVESKKAQLVIIAHDVDPIEVNLLFSILTAVVLVCSVWSLAMMSEFLHLNALCRLTLVNPEQGPHVKVACSEHVYLFLLYRFWSNEHLFLQELSLKCFPYVKPSSLSFSCLRCAVKWVFHTASSRAKLDWADWCTGRHALHLPSHRLTRKCGQYLIYFVHNRHLEVRFNGVTIYNIGYNLI